MWDHRDFFERCDADVGDSELSPLDRWAESQYTWRCVSSRDKNRAGRVRTAGRERGGREVEFRDGPGAS